MIVHGYLMDTNIAIGKVDSEREILKLISRAAVDKQKK